MRFTGWIFTGTGAVGGVLLFLLRQTAWFAAEQAKSMSEAEEFVTSAFWACVIMFLAGVFLLIRSVARKTEQWEQPPAEEEPELWVCQCCGTENSYEDQVCRYCGMPCGSTPRPRQAFGGGDWVCPCCGRVQPENAAVCLACGYDRFADTNQNPY